MIALMFKAEMMMTEEVVLDNYKLSGVPAVPEVRYKHR
jgi:hypothetical protein